MQGRNGGADVKHGLVDTVGASVNRTNGKSCTNIDTLSYTEWTVGEKLLYNIGSPAWSYAMTQRGGLGGREGVSRGRGYIYIIMADLCCMEETNKTL